MAKKKDTDERPLAMKYYDTDAEIIKKLKVNYPIPGLVMKPKLLFQQKNGSYLYRINYTKDDIIKESKLVQVSIVDNKFILTDG